MDTCFPADWSCALTDDELDALDPDLRARVEGMAWATLQSLTAYQIAPCPVLIRPCATGCQPPGGYLIAPVRMSGSFAGVLPGFPGRTPHVSTGGVWVNSCLCENGDCSCTQLCEAILPGPVGGIVEVWLDGVLLPADSYRVDNGNRLVSLDPDVCWPACQDMMADHDEEGAFSVLYYQGFAPDAMVAYAAGVLANEFLKACEGKKCRLPAGVSRVTRQGVTYEITAGSFPGGFTGIQEVDTVIRLFNPLGLTQAPVVSSPDIRRPRATTWGRW